MSKSYNNERSKRRSECRQMLSDYLYTKLGLRVVPTQVRMHPNAEDGYQWSVLSHAQHLFRQNLSKLTTREYTQIIQGIDVIFEAIPFYEKPSTSTTVEEPAMTPETFTSSITRLSNQVNQLQDEVTTLKRLLDSEYLMRGKLEMDLERTQSAYITLRKENTKNQHDSRHAETVTRSLKARMLESNKEFRELLALIRRLESRTNIDP